MRIEPAPSHSAPESLFGTVSLPPPLPRDEPSEAYQRPGFYELYADTPLLYRSGHREGFCRLRLFFPVETPISAETPTVALVTEQPANEGLSITNGIEVIANQICRRYGLNPRHAILIEHYDDREQGCAARLPGRIDGEKFSCIVFEKMAAQANGEASATRLERPQWRSLGKDEVELLIGQKLP